MGDDWKVVPLTDLYTISSGLSKPAGEFGFGHPFLSFKDVFYNYFVPEKLEQLVRSTKKERENCSIKCGDVFLTRTSETMNELGMSSVAIKDYEDATFNGFTKRLRPKPDSEVIPEYAAYYLRSPKFRLEMRAFSTMSTRASLNNEMIGRLNIVLPPEKEQKSIAWVLKNLDEKIEVNRQINQTLEAIAQALFKSWFVDFDPVIDNALAAGNPIPDVFAAKASRRQQLLRSKAKSSQLHAQLLSPNLRQLFPDEFQETEALGWIPKGWKPIYFGDIVRPEKGKNITKETVIDGIVPVVAGGLGPAYFHNRPNVHGPVITVSASGANAGYVNIYYQDIWASDCSFISKSHSEYLFTTYLFLRSRQLEISRMQQGAAQPHVYPKDLMRITLSAPEKDIWELTEKTVAPLFNKVKANLNQISTLTDFRDKLLPKLLSGLIRIPDAESMIG